MLPICHVDAVDMAQAIDLTGDDGAPRCIPGLRPASIRALANQGYCDCAYDRIAEVRITSFRFERADDHLSCRARCRGTSDYSVRIRSDLGGSITKMVCTCSDNRGRACKHICAVLERLRDREAERRAAAREASKRRAQLERMERASVFVVYYDKSEVDSGSDYRYSETIPDSFDAETLGVFLKRCNANECARGKVEELRDEGTEYFEENGGVSAGGEDFLWEGTGPDDVGRSITDRVYVRRYAIEDPSAEFHM